MQINYKKYHQFTAEEVEKALNKLKYNNKPWNRRNKS